jgi:hypothetical protein
MSMTRIRVGRVFDGTGAPIVTDAAVFIEGEGSVSV